MKHDHSFARGEQTGHQCRLCATNDPEAVIEDIAAAMWESLKSTDLPDQSWATASDYWQITFRGYARAFVAVVKR